MSRWCVVDLVDWNRSRHRLSISHSDPPKVKLAWELEHAIRLGVRSVCLCKLLKLSHLETEF